MAERCAIVHRAVRSGEAIQGDAGRASAGEFHLCHPGPFDEQDGLGPGSISRLRLAGRWMPEQVRHDGWGRGAGGIRLRPQLSLGWRVGVKAGPRTAGARLPWLGASICDRRGPPPHRLRGRLRLGLGLGTSPRRCPQALPLHSVQPVAAVLIGWPVTAPGSCPPASPA